MFYWAERTRRGSGAPDGLGGLSKAEILRGIVTEKLTTAAQEILAVVERTVTGYEEEASGFRREIARQKKQLELLLQPRVKLERKAPLPDEEGHKEVVMSEEEEEEEQQPGLEDTGSLGLMWFDDDEEEEEEPSLSAPKSSSETREDREDPDFQIKPRRRPGRPRLSDAHDHLDLRICILQDSQTAVISKRVFQRSPVQEVRCPRGLQQDDFLLLLRSTFPQLGSEAPFDLFTAGRSRRLQPLRAAALTPEEICRSIRLTGAGNSALYIRLKTGDEAEDLRAPRRRDETPSGCDATPGDQNRTDSRDSSERRPRGRPRLREEPTHHFRVCVLEDSQSDVLSKGEFLKSSIQELQCPRGQQEADFLLLLRSTFPQLAGGGDRFDLFKADRSRRLQRLHVATLTPDEIARTIKGTRVEKTLLYIRQKTGEEEEPKEEEPDEEAELNVLQRGDEAGRSSSASQRPAESRVDSSGDEDKEGGDADWKPEESARAERGGAEEAPVVKNSRTACKVCGVGYSMAGGLIKHAWGHVEDGGGGACGVCGERFDGADELRRHLRSYQKTHECSFCDRSFLSVTGLNSHTAAHTGARPFKCDACGKSFLYMSGLSVHRWVHVADKPHRCDLCPKAFGLKAQLVAHRKSHAARDRFHCNVCGKSLHDRRSLTRHKTTHSGERRYGCGVCGKRFKLANTLKSHEKIHTARERPFLCHVCCKAFHSNAGLTAHIKTHGGERPFGCIICGKGFISNGELKTHMRVHTGEAPYGCSECGRHFKRKTHLTNHVRSHLGVKLFVCSVCGKACSRQEHLTVHMRTHNGERPYQCVVCGKAFTQSHCLKTHMKSHRPDDGEPQGAS